MDLAKFPRAVSWAWNWARLRGIEVSPCLLHMSSVEGQPILDLRLEWVGLMPQVGPETLQLEGHTGVRVESIVEGASRGPCTV